MARFEYAGTEIRTCAAAKFWSRWPHLTPSSQALLMLQSPEAVREHWIAALLAHWRTRPDLLPRLHSATVDDRQIAVFLRDAWATLCASIDPSAVLVNTTTGMSLHHAVLAECLSNIATSSSWRWCTAPAIAALSAACR